MRDTSSQVAFWLFALLFLPISGGCSGPQRAAEPSLAVSEAGSELPVDDRIVMGVLDNGFTYYVRQNSRPANRAELRLAVNAGSILEDDDQLGLAHFLEHMAFNGTRNFEKQSLVDYLESIGTEFGPDLNAYTAADETVYLLEVRTDSADQLSTGLDVLREWASRITLDAGEIEKERGVVLEEWRLGRGASARVRDRHLPVLLKGSRYAERLPIGDPEILRTFSPETLRRFYTDWYRPDLMAVVAVGDFDPEAIEAGIVDRFSDMRNPEGAGKRREYDVPGHEVTLVSIATDPELPYGSVHLVFKREAETEGTVKAFRADIVQDLYNSMLEARLDELLQQTEPPFTAAFSQDGAFARGAEFHVLSALVRDGLYMRAFETLLIEAERARRHGFTAGELERQKTAYKRYYDRAVAEKDKTESGRYAAEYVRHFLTGEPAPGIEREYELVTRLLPVIDISEVNASSNRYISRKNRVVQVSAPDSEQDSVPSEAQIRELLEAVTARSIDPYEDTLTDGPLMERIPEPGSIVHETVYEDLGVYEFDLSNGSRVLAKPTDFKNDEILFSAYSPGGYSLAPESLFVPASMASGIISASGVGAFGPNELQKKLTGKLVYVAPSVGLLSEGFRGSTSPEDLETLFQLVHLLAVAPRADSVAYESVKARMGSMLLSAQAGPTQAFSDTISVTMSRYHPLARPFTQETLNRMNLAASYGFYRNRFADMSDFTFYIVGAFDPDSLKDLVSRYLGSLPAIERSETWRDVGIRPPEGAVRKTVRRGIEPQGRVRMIYTGTIDWSLDNRRLLSVLSSAFQIKLREVLREDLGGTYGVGVSGSLSRHPYSRFQVNISFACDPERVDELLSTVHLQVDSLRSAGLPSSYLQKVRESTIRGHETNLERNAYWLSALSYNDRNGLPLTDIPDGIVSYVGGLTADDLQAAANTFLGTPNVATFILLPETDE